LTERIQQLEESLKMLRRACAERMNPNTNQRGWIRADWVDEECRRALEENTGWPVPADPLPPDYWETAQ
jgi:hypothetical protein